VHFGRAQLKKPKAEPLQNTAKHISNSVAVESENQYYNQTAQGRIEPKSSTTSPVQNSKGYSGYKAPERHDKS
jgi:hypothetical protein